ncbi:poly(glycerol-phosphate) alpha-glucosyltransferase [Methylovirgula ligni]|uniref:Poly(Glycerol-phosphate) alpha-glucosyltransferase n=1 Tax=Methylovirgula ligni TaxID=569860 RepID=A0A3D9Z1N9_9HYPH|nr:glycosyltransferase [Methylovirgula ligni]REF89047.1 poly(glycerol-phosphate) alpha-glucosyltransferase [Methylovirgula ligni]
MTGDEKNQRVLRLGLLTARASRLGGGVFEAVVAQAQALKAHGGITPIVFGAADEFTAEDKKRLGTVELVSVPSRGPAAFDYAPGLLPLIRAADLDILHLHGIWQYVSLCGAGWAEATKRPYLISPHGMLDPWITARGRWKKALARVGYERRSWRDASLFHALTEAEARDIARETGTEKSRIAVVPNYVAADTAPPAPRAPLVLYIGRIHPKKNLEALVEAWSAAQASEAGYRLAIAGWGEPAHVAALQARFAALADPGIAFLGPVYGEQKQKLLREARFMVLPSLSEGLPMAVLEAWAAATPSLMSAACNLPEGFAQGAALETGVDSASIAATLRRAFALPAADWQAMSAVAHALAQSRFSPQAIAAQWAALYHRLAAGEYMSGP